MTNLAGKRGKRRNAALNLTDGGGSAEELADAGSQKEARTGDEANNPPRPPDRFFLVFWTFIALTVTAIAGIVRWNFLPPGDRYFWPASADDWAAWGTWASAVGAIGAVYFASQSIKHTIEAQKGTERELKADREHDRKEREHERELVREEREALKKQIDQLALKEARQLSFKYHWGPPPPDYDYLDVHDEQLQSLLEEDETRRQSGIEAEEENDDRKLSFVHVVIRNRSRDLAFNDLSLWLREKDRKVTSISVADRVVPAAPRIGEFLEGSPPAWIWRNDYEEFFPPGTNQWSLGSIKASSQMLVKLEFATPQFYDDWDHVHLWSSHETWDDPRHLILGYRDQAARHWVRSTRSRRNEPQRLLEAKTVS